ncbi:hypothetical protein [Kingella denitrificans]
MIAIVLFIFLAIWILLTKFAMKIGRLLFRRFHPDNLRAERWGAFWGFMLAMGWVLVYWTVEAVVVRRYTVEMCRQAGFKTYVTPEQWKQMVGGEEAWRSLTFNDPYRTRSSFDHSQHIVFNGKKYESQMHWNERVLTFTKNKARRYAMMTDRVYFDTVTKTVLFQEVLVSTGASPLDMLGWLKPWFNYILPRCEIDGQELSDMHDLYFFNPNLEK